MLILSRNVGESIIIGDNLRVTVLKIQGKTIDLGLEDLAHKRNFPNLSAKEDQRIQIGEGVSILVVEIRGKQVRLGINSPPDIAVLRGDLYEKGKLEKTQL